MVFMKARKKTFSREHSGSHKNATSQNNTYRHVSSVHPMAIDRHVCCRSIHRADVIKRMTASKKSAIVYLEKAGILDKSGELTSLYR